MSVNRATLAKFDVEPTKSDFSDYSNVEGFMKAVFRKDKAERVSEAVRTPSLSDIDDFERTSNLIESASQAIDTLSNRCEILEAELEQERDVCSDQSITIDNLKELVLELKAKNAFHESDAKNASLRFQTAEKRVAELEQNQKAVDLRASKAETISVRLQQQVEAAFGQGSPIRSVMESVQLQLAAE